VFGHGWLALACIVDSDNSELVCGVGFKQRHIILSGHHGFDATVLVR